MAWQQGTDTILLTGEKRLSEQANRTGMVSAVFGEVVEVWRAGSDPVLAFQTRSVGAAVVGDRVDLKDVPGDEGEISWRISGRRSRERCLWRSSRRRRSQLVAAHVDRLAIILAVDPPPKTGLVDRYLVATESQSIPAMIILNKIDLPGSEPIVDSLAVYGRLDYEVLPVSALTGEGVASVETRLASGLTVLVGHSGVGKTTLLNLIIPGVELPTRELSSATGKGRHTTSAVTAHPFREGMIADTPGIREFGLVGIEPETVSAGFREIAAAEDSCRFSDCTHREEPGCAVKTAVDNGVIDCRRYESYLRVRESLEAGER